MKYLFVLLNIPLVITIISSCGTNDKKHADTAISKVDFEIIKTGTLHGAGEEGFSRSAILIRDKDQLNKLKSQVNSVNEELKEELIQNETFFKENMMIFVFDKVRSTGGYTIEVSEIFNTRDTLIVKTLSSSPSGEATSIMTQPFQVVKLEKIDKNVALEFIE